MHRKALNISGIGGKRSASGNAKAKAVVPLAANPWPGTQLLTEDDLIILHNWLPGKTTAADHDISKVPKEILEASAKWLKSSDKLEIWSGVSDYRGNSWYYRAEYRLETGWGRKQSERALVGVRARRRYLLARWNESGEPPRSLPQVKRILLWRWIAREVLIEGHIEDPDDECVTVPTCLVGLAWSLLPMFIGLIAPSIFGRLTCPIFFLGAFGAFGLATFLRCRKAMRASVLLHAIARV
jgi:hypothetical protein